MDIGKVSNIIKLYEGLRLLPYTCSSGKLTIGYGRNLEDNGIHMDEAEHLLANDIAQAEKDCRQVFKEFGQFSEGRQIALVSMMFNLGLTRFMKYVKMIAAVENRNWELVKAEMKDSVRYEKLTSRVESEMSLI